MPNWASNETELLGSEKDIREILRLAQQTQYGEGGFAYESPFSLNGVLPMPKELEGTTASVSSPEEFAQALAGNKEFEYSDWYYWRLANWGTKWDLDTDTTYVGEVVVQDDNASVSLSYDTAWSPINDFWLKVSEMFPKVRIDNRYYEEGMNFIGQTIFEGGETLADECGEISSEDYKKAGATLDDEGNIDWEEDQDYNLWSLFPLVEL